MPATADHGTTRSKLVVAQPAEHPVPLDLGASPGVRRWVIDRIPPDQSLLAHHGQAPRQPPWSALHWLWCIPGAEPALPVPLVAHRVREHLGWDYERTWPDGIATPGIKQLSILHRGRNTTDEEFLARYRAHVPEAKRHMPGLWKYVQNVYDPLPAERTDPSGISELWFASVDDFRDRYWATPETQAEENAEVATFLSSRTWSLLAIEHIQLDLDR